MHTGISEPGVASVTPIETLSGVDNAKSHYSAVYHSNNPVSSGLSSHNDDQGQGIPKPIQKTNVLTGSASTSYQLPVIWAS